MQPIRLLKHNCRGSVLIVGLFTLALLSLLGAAATTTSRTDVSITGNAKTLQEAFYAAEVGLAMGEMKVDQVASRLELNEEMPVGLDGKPIGLYGEKEHPDWDEMAWDNEDSVLMDPLAPPNGLDHLYELPRYTIEQLYFNRDSLVQGIGHPTGTFAFNIYAKGTGSSSKTQSVLQSIFVKRFE